MAHTDRPDAPGSPAPPPPSVLAAGHEPNVVSSRGVARFLIGLAMGTAFFAVLVWGVFQLLKRDARSEDRPLPANVARQLERVPPAPRLEDRPLAPRAQLNARENAILGSYGWVDKKAGTVRIPIERAMDLIAHRGLPATGSAPAGSPAAGAASPEKPLPPAKGAR
ncbi:MAG TPA: hypothetical protein VIZ69_07570 [Thermoanaerobaculia bacterium]